MPAVVEEREEVEEVVFASPEDRPPTIEIVEIEQRGSRRGWQAKEGGRRRGRKRRPNASEEGEEEVEQVVREQVVREQEEEQEKEQHRSLFRSSGSAPVCSILLLFLPIM